MVEISIAKGGWISLNGDLMICAMIKLRLH